MPSPRHAFVHFDAPDYLAIEVERMTYKNANLAPRTISSYAADARVFRAWLEASGQSFPVSEETLELYVCDLIHRGRKITTAERHCFAIQREHRLAGHPSPYGAEVKRVLRGARRILAQTPTQKAAIELCDLRAIVRTLGARTPIRARDSALLVFGFATALRRSTLAALRLEDVQFTRDGFLVTVRHEKQHRKGEVRKLAVPYGKSALCPVKILRRWLRVRGDGPGALFCCVMRGCPTGKHIHGNRVGQIVQNSVALVGLDRLLYSGHSLRAGFATEALARGANEIAVARQTGHASLDTLRLYERSRNLFRGSAAGMLGL